MVAFIFRPKRRRGGRVCTSRTWWLRYRLDDDGGAVRAVNLGVRDKQVAEQKKTQFVREQEREAAGIIAPKALRDAAARSLADHLVEFVADLKAKGRASKYVRNTRNHVTRLLDECEWKLPRDVTAGSFVSWRAGQVGKSAKTLNEYLNAAFVFFGWMQRHGRLISNPLAAVGRVETRGKQVRIRKALTSDEVGRLLAIAGNRKPVYLAAVLLGLRRSELVKLQWGDVHLEAVRPFVSVREATTKNKKPVVMLLRDDLTAELRSIRPAGVADSAAVFDVPSMDEYVGDLASAGIPEFDGQGRRSDFHALRYTLNTMMAAAGVAPRVAMEVMRHSDMRLTAKTYTDVSLLPMADVMDRLPRFESTQKDTHAVVNRCPVVSQRVTMAGILKASDQAKNQGIRQSSSHGVTQSQNSAKSERVGIEPTRIPVLSWGNSIASGALCVNLRVTD